MTGQILAAKAWGEICGDSRYSQESVASEGHVASSVLPNDVGPSVVKITLGEILKTASDKSICAGCAFDPAAVGVPFALADPLKLRMSKVDDTW